MSGVKLCVPVQTANEFSDVFPQLYFAMTLTSVSEVVCCPQWLYCQHGPAWKLQKLPDIQVTSFLLPQGIKKKKKELLQSHQKIEILHLFKSFLDKCIKSAHES